MSEVVEQNRYNLGSTQSEQSTLDMEGVIRKIVYDKTHEVTNIVDKIRSWLKDETTELSDQEIEDIILQLPIVLYNSMDEQEVVGMQLDMANQIHKEAYSEAYKLARGTIADKNAVADLQTRAQQLEKIIYDRSYKIIRQKFEMAVETLNAVKKVQASRQQRYDLNRFSNKF